MRDAMFYIFKTKMVEEVQECLCSAFLEEEPSEFQEDLKFEVARVFALYEKNSTNKTIPEIQQEIKKDLETDFDVAEFRFGYVLEFIGVLPRFTKILRRYGFFIDILDEFEDFVEESEVF